MSKHEPVDAVITWVDGDDKLHQQKLSHYLPHLTTNLAEAVAPTRFKQCGEIDYCVYSILRFAPWIRYIFIVTDAQTPPIIQRLKGTGYAGKVKLIDHRDVFANYENNLPTFNSLSIETVLWRIKELANQFIYFNDDCFLIKPVTYEDFFRENKVILRGHWKVFNEAKWQNKFIFKAIPFLNNKIKAANDHRLIQENTAKLQGHTKYFFHLPHVPFPLVKSTFSHFFEQNPDLLTNNIQYRIRNSQQFWSIALFYYLAMKENKVVYDNALEGMMINAATHPFTKIGQRLDYAQNNKQAAFMCLQSLDMATDNVQNFIFDWLNEQINFKCLKSLM